MQRQKLDENWEPINRQQLRKFIQQVAADIDKRIKENQDEKKYFNKFMRGRPQWPAGTNKMPAMRLQKLLENSDIDLVDGKFGY